MGFGGVDNARFRKVVEPDCRIILAALLKQQSRRMFRFQTQGFVRGVLVFENERGRVRDGRTAPGQKSSMHTHPALVGFSVSACHWILSSPGGDPVEVNIAPGEAFFQEAVTHAAEDVGTTGSHAILVELK